MTFSMLTMQAVDFLRLQAMNVYIMSTSLSLAALSKEGVPRGGIPSRSYFEDHLTPGDGVGITEPNVQLAGKRDQRLSGPGGDVYPPQTYDFATPRLGGRSE